MSAFHKTRPDGFTLIELMIALAIFGIVLSLGMPSYRTWVQNTQIRNAAESIQNGIQKARAEAVKRNTSIEFVLPYDPNPPHLVTNPLWRIQLPGNTLTCPISVTPLTTLLECANTGGAKNVTVATTPIAPSPSNVVTITFNNLGTVGAPPNEPKNADGTAALTRVDLDSSILDPADSRDLSVTINAGGNARVCDPDPSLAAKNPPDPRRCY